MKKYVLLIFILLLLVGCGEEVKVPDDDMLVTYEKGDNFTDYMRTTYKDANPKLYEMLYTHKLDYLVPQVFYYIPMDNELNNYEDWEVYFENWSLALKNHDMDSIKNYVEGSTLESYIEKKFEEAIVLDIVSVFIDQYAGIYLDGFKAYESMWPDISKDLYTDAKALDEYLKSMNMINAWHDVTGLNLDLQIRLSYYSHEDLRSTSTSNRKVVLFKTGQSLDEIYGDLSLIYGRHLLQNGLTNIIKDLYKKYAYLDEPLDKVFKTLTDDMIKVYDAKVRGVGHEFEIELPPVVTQYEASLDVLSYCSLVYEWYLDELKSKKPYLVDGLMYYSGATYDKIDIASGHVYYRDQWPIIVEYEGEFKILTDDMDNVPHVSPDKSKIAFISPYAFETYGHIYVYDLKKRLLTQLHKSEYPNGTVKVLKWYDDETLLYISGFPHGTVTRGGNLYYMNIDDKVEELLVEAEGDKLEISDVFYDEAWYYTLVTHNEEMTDYTEEIIQLDTIKTMLID